MLYSECILLLEAGVLDYSAGASTSADEARGPGVVAGSVFASSC